MITLRKAAENCLYDCAVRIVSGDESAWKLVDRIERRWHMQGATSNHVNRMRASQRAFKIAESKRHDFIYPDRLSYLHR